MNTKDFLRLGVPLGAATRRATDFVAKYVLRGGDAAMLEDELKGIVANPTPFSRTPSARTSPGPSLVRRTPLVRFNYRAAA